MPSSQIDTDSQQTFQLQSSNFEAQALPSDFILLNSWHTIFSLLFWTAILSHVCSLPNPRQTKYQLLRTISCLQRGLVTHQAGECLQQSAAGMKEAVYMLRVMTYA